MKKLILAISSLFIFSNIANASPDNRNNTIKINLESIPNQIIEQITPDAGGLIKSSIDLTNVVIFARDWKDNDVRRDKIMDLSSTVIPQAFKKFPQSKEFEFSTFINCKNKISHKNEIKKISTIVITKDDFYKVDWKNFKNINQDNKKYFKVMNFSSL